MPKNYVLKSTQESRDSQTTSILAIVETIFFTFLTWGVAVYFDTYIHIYTAIAIAPFLLLKTPESIDKAIEWFLYEPEVGGETYFKEPYFWFGVSIAALLVFFISYFFSTEILVHYKGWEFFFLSVLLGIIEIGVMAVAVAVAGVGTRVAVGVGVAAGGVVVAVAGVVVVAGVVAVVVTAGAITAGVILIEGRYIEIKNKFLQSLIFLLSSPVIIIFGAIFGSFFLIKSIIIKIIITTFYTLRHPLKTFFYISKNYNEQIMVNDLFYGPELLPELAKKHNGYQVSTILPGLKSSGLIINAMLAVSLIWSLGYLYRFSIKSTSWFFFPLAYLANLEALQDEEKKKKAIKTQTWKNLFWFNTIIAAILFLYFKSIGQYIDLLGLSETKLNFIKDAMLRLQKYFIPEAMWLLVVAVGLYFVLYMFISRQEHLRENQYPMLTYWLIKLIAALWMIFLGWHLVVLINHELVPIVKVWLGRT